VRQVQDQLPCTSPVSQTPYEFYGYLRHSLCYLGLPQGRKVVCNIS
jgi:hypothetical protein